ncbi:Beta-lactamase superfamily domain protein [Legionella quinlivanii]|uniref:Beta-lactamase superfamily domain protein n=1 Tax=Legionella quinlivanii TaxID=45073 RepID=A0A0W0Y480_9GAMM|nr:ligase-associated DNA damage response exonuclease [Legionella quinlivanii]KTD51487.1 Beta-lactamase superfamily domain protein [Legionella quinlivanii]MCW8450824.1 ligase-associated DNA damage response exonuclease [Legionella quinlivanii]SEF56783.1 putative mRNA 3-end processing factor [Legionella quinlivanii DSM 21216]STY10987.1 F0F1-type ATP synthase, epsilon subunit (mitochondrial delta subunit) [Legionella quinlivanii]
MGIDASTVISLKPEGLYCIPGAFYIDPLASVKKAIITHAHSDHARMDHQEVLATSETIELMQIRYGEDCKTRFQGLAYHSRIKVKDVTVYFLPAGHILGSAQIVIVFKGYRLIISGDYKRSIDPTCAAFETEPANLLVTEATFGLPVFKHPPIESELNRLLVSMKKHPGTCHIIAAYALGKAQRLIKSLRISGFDEPVYIHGALSTFCEFYQQKGIDLGDLRSASQLSPQTAAGKLVICPPSALQDRWNRRFGDIRLGYASGWMRIRARAKQKGIDLPLVISDHADWNELTQTIEEINPELLWVTHGSEEALVYYARQKGYQAHALHLLGYEENME